MKCSQVQFEFYNCSHSYGSCRKTHLCQNPERKDDSIFDHFEVFRPVAKVAKKNAGRRLKRVAMCVWPGPSSGLGGREGGLGGHSGQRGHHQSLASLASWRSNQGCRPTGCPRPRWARPGSPTGSPSRDQVTPDHRSHLWQGGGKPDTWLPDSRLVIGSLYLKFNLSKSRGKYIEIYRLFCDVFVGITKNLTMKQK